MTSPDHTTDTDRLAEIRARLDYLKFSERRKLGKISVPLTKAELDLREHAPEDLSWLLSELEAAQARLDAAAELHRPVHHRGFRVCNACTPLDVLMQTMSGRGRGGVEYPCATARALGLGEGADSDR